MCRCTSSTCPKRAILSLRYCFQNVFLFSSFFCVVVFVDPQFSFRCIICLFLYLILLVLTLCTLFIFSVFLQVHQEDMRCHGAPEYMDVGVSILKVNETYGTYVLILILRSAVRLSCTRSRPCLFIFHDIVEVPSG